MKQQLGLIARNRQLLAYLKDQPVKRAYLFGSYARGEATPQSDIDILLEMNPNLAPLESGDVKLNLSTQLPKILNCKVDIIDQQYLTNSYLIETIESEKILFYEQVQNI